MAQGKRRIIAGEEVASAARTVATISSKLYFQTEVSGVLEVMLKWAEEWTYAAYGYDAVTAFFSCI